MIRRANKPVFRDLLLSPITTSHNPLTLKRDQEWSIDRAKRGALYYSNWVMKWVRYTVVCRGITYIYIFIHYNNDRKQWAKRTSKINTKRKKNKCVSKTDTNPPFAFQIAFPRGTDFAGFLHGGSKSRDLQSEISVRIESRIESADSRLQLQC